MRPETADFLQPTDDRDQDRDQDLETTEFISATERRKRELTQKLRRLQRILQEIVSAKNNQPDEEAWGSISVVEERKQKRELERQYLRCCLNIIDVEIGLAKNDKLDGAQKIINDAAVEKRKRELEHKYLQCLLDIIHDEIKSVKNSQTSRNLEPNGLAYFLLATKALASGSFRYFILYHLMRLIQQEPFVADAAWTRSFWLVEVFPAVCALNDVVLTYLGTKDSTVAFCNRFKLGENAQHFYTGHILNHDVGEIARDLSQQVCRMKDNALHIWSQYPKLFLLMSPFGLFAAGWKATIGIQNELERAALAITPEPLSYLTYIFWTFASSVGLVNAIIYLAFKLVGQGVENIHIKNALKNSDAWKEFCKEKRSFFYKQHFINFFTSIFTALIVGMSAFYSKSAFNFTWENAELCFSLVIPETILCLFWTINPSINRTKMLAMRENNSQETPQPINVTINNADAPVVTEHPDAQCRKLIMYLIIAMGIFSSFGTGLSIIPTFIGFSRLVGNKPLSEQPETVCIPVMVLGFIFACVLAGQDYIFWTKQYLLKKYPDPLRRDGDAAMRPSQSVAQFDAVPPGLGN
ncbi:MAG: hypothetical protein ACD_70C00116G0002 [uncultured bacterium]|nr:MAG: hypothetical protein ACD_70C00116G0002 [uncultured bacterium]OGT26208.1 MAG: hypothetical protein A3B71_06780 [Gammaproteobacteria bacterium RIFCSPHIGHO2_02_FULL_42_43]OGT28508.1 MAG: hypothetical protein A2624_00850 [Gammaproteobacteria bacterium RIFCSPHIGHO2_01_FULL_42_8]OGT52585.1 MAG: hypothetical protein A3E54_06380 [Gammaproteobacteria bacterium RIFCSPHIGHO2_12_FULL_41_25]OGT63183.1 MAG: hypothetical protein A3I77_06185 [Gammaproteobacteria bacterium RIFCSPLOWO2_02_FULL_42_14]OGT